MNPFLLFVIIAIVLVCIMFYADFFPKCSLCGKIKPRAFFKIHKIFRVLPGYKGNRSACYKCCRKYDIHNIKDLIGVKKIKRNVEINVNLD